MLSLLERNIATIEERLVLVAPPDQWVPSSFRNVVEDSFRHEELVAEMQRLRGSIYVEDGAIKREHLVDGRHQTPEDSRSWHLLIMNRDGGLSSCAWYMEHARARSLQDLRARHCPLAKQEATREHLNAAISRELETARRERLRYAEVGGWAVSKRSRCTAEGLLLALATYGLGRYFGGALGLTTATVRHGSSTILRRLGGASLEVNGRAVPSYFDPKYDCEMELLRFDSRKTNPKYDGMIHLLASRLSQVRVVATSPLEVEAGLPLFGFGAVA